MRLSGTATCRCWHDQMGAAAGQAWRVGGWGCTLPCLSCGGPRVHWRAQVGVGNRALKAVSRARCSLTGLAWPGLHGFCLFGFLAAQSCAELGVGAGMVHKVADWVGLC